MLLETLRAFLDAGGALEATARALFVHTNTVRYRLRRVAEICGESPTDPRGAYVAAVRAGRRRSRTAWLTPPARADLTAR